MQINLSSLRAAAWTTLHAALAWAGRTLPILFKTAASTIREDFSHPLTPREQTSLFLAGVAIWLWVINELIVTVYTLIPVLSYLLAEQESWPLFSLMALSGAAGVGSTLLWLIGRELRRRGGLGGKLPASRPVAGPSIPVQK